MTAREQIPFEIDRINELVAASGQLIEDSKKLWNEVKDFSQQGREKQKNELMMHRYLTSDEHDITDAEIV